MDHKMVDANSIRDCAIVECMDYNKGFGSCWEVRGGKGKAKVGNRMLTYQG